MLMSRVHCFARVVIVCGLVLPIAACSAHSSMKLGSATDTVPVDTTQRVAPHSEPVFVTKETLAPGTYRVIARIDVGKSWYGGPTAVYQSLADRARELGADAVIQVETWLQPSGFSWAAPHGSGQAVKLLKGDPRAEFAARRGDWR